MIIQFGANKQSVYLVNNNDFRKGHPFIDYFCEKMNGTIVTEEPVVDRHLIIKHVGSSIIKASYQDYPNLSDRQIEDIFATLIDNFNKELKKSKEVLFRFGRSTLTLSKLDYPNINDDFINTVQHLLDDYCTVFTKSDKSSSYYTVPIGKYSCLAVDMDDYVELHQLGYYVYSDKFANVIYTINYIYDPSKPLQTSSSVQTTKLTNLFNNIITDYSSGNVKDNYIGESIGKLCNILKL